MNYDDENWIKVYTRDTAGWLSLSWQARGLMLEISRRLPKHSGELSTGRKGLAALAGLLRAPWSEIEPFIAELVEDGRLEYDAEAQVIRDPQHVDRQSAIASGAARTKKWRESHRTSAIANDDHVTSRDAGVTPCDAVRQDVTPRDQEKRREEKREEKKEEKEITAPQAVLDVPGVGKKVSRGTRLPDGWTPGEETQAWARSNGVADPCGRILDEFRDFWAGVPGSRGVKLDWDATYRNRVRQVAGNGSGHGGGGKRGERQPLGDPNAKWLKTGSDL